MRDLTDCHVWCDLTHAFVIWCITMFDMTHPHVWYDTLLWVTWLIHICDTTCHVWHAMTYPCMWHAMTYPCMWHDGLPRVTWHDSCMCDMLHSPVWLDACTCVIWHTLMCDMTHPRVWRDMPCVMPCVIRHDSSACVTWHTAMCDMTYLHVRHDTGDLALFLDIDLSILGSPPSKYAQYANQVFL